MFNIILGAWLSDLSLDESLRKVQTFQIIHHLGFALDDVEIDIALK